MSPWLSKDHLNLQVENLTLRQESGGSSEELVLESCTPQKLIDRPGVQFD